MYNSNNNNDTCNHYHYYHYYYHSIEYVSLSHFYCCPLVVLWFLFSFLVRGLGLVLLHALALEEHHLIKEIGTRDPN